MDTDNPLQTKAKEVTEKVNALILLKDKVDALQQQKEKTMKAINLALQNTQLFKNFFKDIGEKLNNVDIKEVITLLREVEKNEAQLNGFLELDTKYQ